MIVTKPFYRVPYWKAQHSETLRQQSILLQHDTLKPEFLTVHVIAVTGRKAEGVCFDPDVSCWSPSPCCFECIHSVRSYSHLPDAQLSGESTFQSHMASLVRLESSKHWNW